MKGQVGQVIAIGIGVFLGSVLYKMLGNYIPSL